MSSVLFDAFNLSSAASLDFQTIFSFMKPLVDAVSYTHLTLPTKA